MALPSTGASCTTRELDQTMNNRQCNILYRTEFKNEVRTLQTVFNSLKGKLEMRKAIVHLQDIDSLDQQSESRHILEMDQNSTDEDLLDQISELELNTEKVCSDWSWITPRTVADIKTPQIKNTKHFNFSDAVVEIH